MNRALAAALVLLGAAGCLSLGSPPPPPRYYVLAPGAGRAAPPAASPGAHLLLGLGPVRLPAYLDRAQVVTRAGPERLEVSPGDRWAASLPLLFTRGLADRLRQVVPAEVAEWPWLPGTAPELRIVLDVRRFEREVDGAAVLEAAWTVHAGKGGEALARSEARLREPAAGADMSSSVAALSRALDALAVELAASVSAVRRTP